jgi:DNA helicase-2/ATP-dependent DNA helicase PcrA
MNDRQNDSREQPKASEGLNALQREAVQAGNGPVLVEAAVGSGKTRVLTHRLAWLLETGRVEADRLLVLTFTNRAAREMRERVRAMLGPGAAAAIRFFGTFHSVCRRLLNEELPLEQYGYRKGFTIYDEAERRVLIGELAGGLGSGSGGRPRLGELVRSTVRLKQAACGSFFFADSGELSEMPDSPLDLELHRLYQERLLAANAMDFDDLILLPLRMLIDHADVRKRIGQRFDHILVDEFQDTDRLQYLLLKGLLGPGKSLYVVGDPNQSIYTWRGACPEMFRRFREEYPGSRSYTMGQHYRSSSTILQAAARLADTIPPWTENEPGPPVRVIACDDERHQADWVAREARRLNLERGIPFGSMAVLYRVNAQAPRVEAALRRDGVPVRVVSPKNLTDLPPVRKLLALFKALLNPSDQLSLMAAATLPGWKLTPLMLGALRQAAERHGLTPGQALFSLDDLDDLPAKTRERAALYAAALEDLGAEAMVRPPAEVFDLAVERSGFREKEIRVHTAAGEELWQRILEIRNRAADQEGLDPWDAWPAFLAQISLSAGAAGSEQGVSDRALNLMTIHAAKGLEFEVVFIIGLNEGLLPLAGKDEGTPEFEEESRLFYVAMTRARQHLLLTHMLAVSRRGAAPWPSRFLDRLPRSLIESSGPLPRAGPGRGSFLGGDGRLPRQSRQADELPPEAVPGRPLGPGVRVTHPRLGQGVVLLHQEGRIRIRFDSGEEKDLLAAFSPELEISD